MLVCTVYFEYEPYMTVNNKNVLLLFAMNCFKMRKTKQREQQYQRKNAANKAGKHFEFI